MKYLRNTSANPVVALLLNIFVLPGLGSMMIGQTHKGLMTLLAAVLGFFLCCIPGTVIVILSHIDAYQCAAALQRGETLGENQYKQELLYKIVHLFDKSAIYLG